MPPAETILAGLTAIANEWRALAIAWHALLGALVLALLAGWRPSNRLAGFVLVVPLASASALAWVSGNPFNGAAFAALALGLAVEASRFPRQRVTIASPVALGSGVLLFAFGWGYPHFLRADTWIEYTYAAPLGLIPCPTLAALIGATLALNGLRSAAWSLSLAAAGIVYGAIGAFRLGVTLDLGLLAGAGALGLMGACAGWRSVRAGRRERTRPLPGDHPLTGAGC